MDSDLGENLKELTGMDRDSQDKDKNHDEN
jgi:hypothetical protein